MDLDLPVVGKDGIVIEKAADSEKIEVSGKNLIKDPYPGVNVTGAGIVNYKPINSSDWGMAFIRNTHSLVNNAGTGSIVGYDNNGIIYAKTTSDDPWSVVNKKYVDDNFVKKNPANDRFVYGKNIVNSTLQETIYYVDQGNFSQVGRIPVWIAPDSSHTLASVNNPVTAKVSTPVGEADIANKKYVDDNFVKKPVDPGVWSVLTYNPISKANTYYPMDISVSALSLPYRDSEKNNFKVGDITSA